MTALLSEARRLLVTRKSDGARLCSTCRRRQDRERWRQNHPGRPRRVTD